MHKIKLALASNLSWTLLVSLASQVSKWSLRSAASIFLASCSFLPLASKVAAQNQQLVDQLIFRGATAEQYRESIEKKLDTAISQLQEENLRMNDNLALSNQQIAKLHMAARLDIERFFRELQRIRTEAETSQVGIRQNPQQVIAAIQPLMMKSRLGLFDGNSLLVKTVQNALSSEQRETKHVRELIILRSDPRRLSQVILRAMPGEPLPREIWIENLLELRRIEADARRQIQFVPLRGAK